MLAISFAAFDAKRQACLAICSYLEYTNIIVVAIAAIVVVTVPITRVFLQIYMFTFWFFASDFANLDVFLWNWLLSYLDLWVLCISNIKCQ